MDYYGLLWITMIIMDYYNNYGWCGIMWILTDDQALPEATTDY